MWYPGLHAMRGIAALLVVLLHAYWTWPFAFSGYIRKLYLCVDLFFILSGFVVCLKYESVLANATSFKKFIKARISRLAAVYYVTGICWFIAFSLFYAVRKTEGLNWEILLAAFRYITGIDVLFNSETVRINPVAWSLMAEIWTYTLFGLAFMAVRNPRMRLIVALTFGLGGLGFVVMNYPSFNIVHGPGALARCIGGFFVGVAICEVQILYKQSGLQRVAGTLALLIAAIAITAEYHDFLMVLIFTLLILLLIVGNMHVQNLPKSLMWLGNISYSLYLWHFLVSVVIAKALQSIFKLHDRVFYHEESFLVASPWISIVALVVYLAAAMMIANCSYVFLEKKQIFRFPFIFRKPLA